MTGDEKADKFRFKVVGVYNMKDPQDLFWFQGINEYESSLVIDFLLFSNNFVERAPPLVTGAQWFYAFDYHKINLNNINAVLSTYKAQSKWFDNYRRSINFKMTAIPILQKYSERKKQLTVTLWVLVVPILLMLCFYIFMVSQLIIENDANEIAVLQSRGSSGMQIFIIYLLEGLILAILSLALGPPLGLGICAVLGASNGFMELVQRTALPISLNLKAYLYSGVALIFFMMTMLIPAFLASRTSIVQYKQKKTRNSSIPVWKKFYLDVVILGLAYYGFYRYKNQQMLLNITGIKGIDMGIDPLLFLISTFFVLGAGLLFLRIYPYLVRLIFRAGRKIWSPVFYASFIQIGRSRGKEQFLMLFIILAISIGIFNANTARTLNRNMEDKVRYENGTEIRLQPYWNKVIKNPALVPVGMESDIGQGMDTSVSSSGRDVVQYIEPPFDSYTKLPGVEKATKVLIGNKGKAKMGDQWQNNVQIMGIEPSQFGKVAWFRSDLLPYHWYQYLNLLADAPKAMLVSRHLKEKYKAQEGDTIYITWGNQAYLEGTIYAFIDYWPSFNPNVEEVGKEPPSIVVANFSYIQKKMALEPYEVWISRKPGVTDTLINEALKEAKLKIDNITYTNQEIIKQKNDPLLQGINGLLTLGFLVTMLVSIIGFLYLLTNSAKESWFPFKHISISSLSSNICMILHPH